jgi:hypothetical protein
MSRGVDTDEIFNRLAAACIIGGHGVSFDAADCREQRHVGMGARDR